MDSSPDKGDVIKLTVIANQPAGWLAMTVFLF